MTTFETASFFEYICEVNNTNKMVKKYTTVLLFFLLFFNAKSNTYYVATDGDDLNNGTEPFPWRTIQKAANTLIAGDTVFVKAGTYNERVIVQNSGTLNNNIVFSNFQDDIVIIDGNGISWGASWNGLFDLSYKNYITVIGFRIINADYGGIWADSSAFIDIKNNYTYNTFSCGIGIWNSNNIVIDSNEVELACNDGEQECISIANSSFCEVLKNNVHDNGSGIEGGEGIDVKQGSHDVNIYKNNVHHLNARLGIYADAWDTLTYNINIYQNTVHHCKETGIAVASEAGGTIKDVNIFNNVLYYNKYGGIELGSWSDIGFTGIKPLENINIINNTCYKNGEFDSGWGYGIVVDNPDAVNIIIRNNLCSENSAQLSIQQVGANWTVDHNLLFGENDASGTLYGSDSIVANPLFLDESIYDFHLTENSPAINNGNSLDAPTTDFDGNARPNNNGFDIGAFEYTESSYVETYTKVNSFVKIYPNPIKDKVFISINDKINKTYIVKIINSIGGAVKEIEVDKEMGEDIYINISDINSGLYILNIIDGSRIISSNKIVIN